MDRNTLLYAFTIDGVPSYHCPTCEGGRLKIDGELVSEETEASKKDQMQGWDPELVVLKFNCKLKCVLCSEIVYLIGGGGLEVDHDVDENGEWKSSWVTYYSPKFFYPSIRIISSPKKTPYLVQEQVRAAESIYFSFPDSCCNSIRAAAEEVLSSLGVDVVDEKGGFISFANRINLLTDERASVKVLFDAIRWLGNHGSHPGSGLQRIHALDAFQILELLLEELYSDKKLEIQELARRINEAKGPVGRHVIISGVD